jgi:hypothetical protein
MPCIPHPQKMYAVHTDSSKNVCQTQRTFAVLSPSLYPPRNIRSPLQHQKRAYSSTGIMMSLKFLNSLQLAKEIHESSSESRDARSRAVLAESYRLLNEGSQKCLSYSSRPFPSGNTVGTNTPKITGWVCGVPGVDDLHQVCMWTCYFQVRN